MEREEIWILGKYGQLATCLADEALLFPNLNLVFLSREEINFEHEVATQLNALKNLPKLIINTVAYTAVDKAEDEVEKAFRINGIAVEELCSWCANQNIPLIHFSTDYVFSGNASVPYTEEHETNPINTYGASKLKGEKAVLAYSHGLVFRIAWLYASVGKNFLLTVRSKMINNESLRVVNDQRGCPTSAHALANDVLTIVSQNKITEQSFGLYHYGHEGIISWFDFAEEIREQIQSNSTIQAVSSNEFITAAKRPHFSKLNSAKSISTFGLPIRFWKDELKNELNRLNA